MPGNQDERKSNSDVGGAYGNTTGGYSSAPFSNPFNTPEWRAFFAAAGHPGGGNGSGIPLSHPSAPGASPLATVPGPGASPLSTVPGGTANTANLFGISPNVLFQAGTNLFGNLFGAWMQGNAADKAAAAEAAAVKYAAELQDAAGKRAEQFSREQAENAFLNNEAARRGNYDLNAARERRLGFIGDEVGLGPREIPGYVPGVDPHYTGGGTIGATANAVPPDLSTAKATFDKLFPGDTLTPQMLAAHRPELEAAGFTLNPNAAGLITDLSYGGLNIDPIEGAGSGLNKKQWLVATPGASPALRAAPVARTLYTAPTVPFLSATPTAPALSFMGAY